MGIFTYSSNISCQALIPSVGLDREEYEDSEPLAEALKSWKVTSKCSLYSRWLRTLFLVLKGGCGVFGSFVFAFYLQDGYF